jgi:hypothetical protein
MSFVFDSSDLLLSLWLPFFPFQVHAANFCGAQMPVDGGFMAQ